MLIRGRRPKPIQTMIIQLPQQQIYTYHLVLSLVILFLTLYPYLFSNSNACCYVSAYSSKDLELKHSSIENFDILESQDIVVSKSLHTRSTHELFTKEIDVRPSIIDERTERRRIQFSSLGQRFNLILNKDAQLITHDFNIVTLDQHGKQTRIPFSRKDFEVLKGTLEGDPTSSVTASISIHTKLITAQIKSGKDIIVVEPTYLHKNHLERSSYPHDIDKTINSKLYEKTMIVYNLSDHEQFRPRYGNESSNLIELEKLCAATSVNNDSFASYSIDSRVQKFPIELDVFKYYKPSIFGQKRKLSKRGIEFFYDRGQQQIKDKTRCTLHLVADYLFYKHVGNGDLQTTINYLLALINRVNQIYLTTRWETGEENMESFGDIGFTVQNITIHQDYTRISSGDTHYNMQSDILWGAREYLDNFSRHSPPKHYCLAHLLTYRQFNTPVLGLAYVASTRFGTIGGICSPTQRRGDSLYKHNTGISTSKGINGETLITRQADLVLAHELGHNLGAEHDSNECRPPPARGGAYLMHPYAVMGFEKNNRFLSNCSRIAIGRVIKRKASTCFVSVVGNVCGNGVVEDDEECDGGGMGHGHSDPCCDSSCRFTPGSQCSDRHSWCCSKCNIVPAGRPCRPAEEFNCKQAAYCDGRSAKCPDASPVEDDKICVGRGLCRTGECIPFCEARGLYSCLCNNPPDACKLCCKQSINGTCTPYGEETPYLPDGVLCYRGVCEKGRCEQPIQDVVERLWDVIEDINLTTFVKFLRDNIILVVLFVSIPLWCLATHFINEFDKRIKQDVINTIMKHRRRLKPPPPTQSPFLPRLFVGDGNSSTNSLNELRDEVNSPMKQAFQFPDPANAREFVINGNPTRSSHQFPIGFHPPNLGFQLPEGEEVVIEPRGSIALNSIELPHQTIGEQMNQGEGDSTGSQVVIDDNFHNSNSFSTRV